MYRNTRKVTTEVENQRFYFILFYFASLIFLYPKHQDLLCVSRPCPRLLGQYRIRFETIYALTEYVIAYPKNFDILVEVEQTETEALIPLSL